MPGEHSQSLPPKRSIIVFTKNVHSPGGKRLRWNLGKNLKLKLERGVGFEMVADSIERNAFRVATVKSKSHPGQKCFLVRLHGKKLGGSVSGEQDVDLSVHDFRGGLK